MGNNKFNAKSIFYLTLGYVSFALGFIGIFLPILPTTPFMIVALWAFSKGSKKMHNWLLNHPRFGESLQNWETHKIIPMKAKLTALIFILFIHR
ncbi:MAG: YbaN family protein [Rhizobiales bacterium]|nr:YbaN family protein [Hyphomicrobiales bacterium]